MERVVYNARVIYNSDYGGFSLSKEACTALNESHGGHAIDRTSPDLLKLMDDWGSKRCSGKYAKLAVFDVPTAWENCWQIQEYDGAENVIFDEKKWLLNKLNLVKTQVPQSKDMIETILQTYMSITEGE